MNEPTNFCTGECYWNDFITQNQVPKSQYLNHDYSLVYTPGQQSLNIKTLRKSFILIKSIQFDSLRRSATQGRP